MNDKKSLAQAIKLHQSGKLAAAEGAYRQILKESPDNADALQLLGVIASQANKPDIAAQLIRQALNINPYHVDAHCNLGTALMNMGKWHEAANSFRRALKIDANIPEALNNLGNIWRQLGKLDKAEASYRQALRIAPELAETHSNLGTVLHVMGHFAKAEASYRQALNIDPDNAEAHANLATTLLQTGQMAEGWRQNEWRWRKNSFTSPRRDFPQPQWDGSRLGDGSRLLIHAEQGFGDTIQFIRYALLAAKMAGRLIVECQPQMQRLLKNISAIDELVAQGEKLPHFNVHAPMLSLPMIFATTLDNIPSPDGYIKADAELAAQWCRRLPETDGVKIGIAWQGNKDQKKDRTRSMALTLLAPLMDIKSICFISLQKGDGEEQLQKTALGQNIFNPAPDIEDFADTAAIMANLDLIICVDTAVAHLGGALGKQTWVLLEHVPDWRYMQERTDSPWCSSMRLFRQKTPGDWKSVVLHVKQSLQEYLRQ